MSSCPRTRIQSLTIVLVAVSISICGVASARAQTPVQNGFRDFSYGTKVNLNPTGEKPESKLWFNDGSWWGSLFDTQTSQYQIHRFDVATQTWVNTGTAIDARLESKADVLWDAGTQRLYIVSHVFTKSSGATSSSPTWGKLSRYSYSPGSRTYSLDPGFPVDVTRGKSETLTIVKDFTQRLWVTYVESSKVKINWSLGDDASWGLPINLPVSGTSTAVNSDDISDIVAFPNGDIGVMWSNQKTKSTYFAVHRAVDAPTVWQPVETVLPAAGCSGACADDHFNLKTDQAGRVYAITKTSLDTPGKPLLILAVRDVNSTWTLYTVAMGEDHATRGMVQLDEEQGKIYVFHTSPTGGGAIYLKTSPMNNIAFAPGLGEPFIRSSGDTQISDATSMKENVTAATGLLVLSSDEGSRRYLHNFILLGPPAPAPPSAPSDVIATVVSGHVHLTWTDTSDNELAFEIERAEAGGAFGPPTTLGANVTSYDDSSVAPAHTYSYRLRATNGNGPSPYPSTTSVTTPAPPGAGNIKVITFEGGTITDPATGVDAVSGTVAVETITPLKGSYSARIATKSSYLDETFTPTPDLYLSFEVRLNALPSADVQLLRIMNNGSQVGTFLLRTTGQLRLRNNSTTVGLDSAALAVGQLYRIGIHQRAKIGGTNGVLEGFLASGDSEFALPFAALSTGTWTTSATEIRLGTITSVLVNLVLDDIKLDDTSMPPGVAGPAAPTDLTASAPTASEVQLSWTDASATETAFRIERAGSDGIFGEIATVGTDVTSFADTTVTPATAYHYRVRADDAGNLGLYSNVVDIATPEVPPAAPTNLSADALSSSAVLLSWTDASNNETAFSIERAGNDGVFAPIATLGPNATSYTDDTVAAATGYHYRLRAFNVAGNSGYSNTESVITPLPVVAPAAPTNLTASAPAVNQVQLTWTDNAATEADFRIERAGSNGIFAEIGVVAADVTSFVDPTVVAATTYSYRVRATHMQGASTYSNTATVTTPANAVSGQAIKLMTFETGTITDPSTGADSVSGSIVFETAAPLKGSRSARINGSSAYLQEDFTATSDLYLTFYLRLISVPSSDARLALISNAGTTVGNLLLRSTGQLRLRVNSTTVGADSTPLTAGTLYRIAIHQRAAVGATPRLIEAFVAIGDAAFGAPFAASSSASWSGNADRIRLGATTGSVAVVLDDVRLDTQASAPSAAPDPPTGLTATSASGTAVQLAWSDASTTEASMRVERAENGGGFIEIAMLGANVTSYTDTTVAATPYSYRVRAANAVGFSTYSNQADVTTPAAPAAPAPPTDLVATPSSDTEVELVWNNPATTETTVHVERATSGGAFEEIAVLGADAVSLTDVFATPATAYIYRVRVANATFSSYSNEAAVTTP